MKTSFLYPVNLIKEDDVVRVLFPDWNNTETFGSTSEEALTMAKDLLETMASSAVEGGREIPTPSATKGRPMVGLSIISAAKAGLYLTMKQAGLSKAELARRLGWHPPQVQRLMDLRHNSRMDQLEQAISVLGKQLFVEIGDAA